MMADKVAGLTALYATTMALFHRERTGEGQEVEVAMFETMASFMLVEHANGAMFGPPLGPAIYPRTVAPNRRPYRTSDGYIAVLIYNDRHWPAFVNAVQPVWTSDLYSTLERRARQIDTVYGLVADTAKELATDEWLHLFRQLEIPAAPLQTPAALFDNPHLNEIGFFETLNTPHGPVRFPGVPTWFSRTAGRVAGPAPQPGADTAEVLDELGLGADAAQGSA
jgi:crotonobetainyl-CoA:carnitine CoA-transferase CaiB-like acyl-CoA transferase